MNKKLVLVLGISALLLSCKMTDAGKFENKEEYIIKDIESFSNMDSNEAGYVEKNEFIITFCEISNPDKCEKIKIKEFIRYDVDKDGNVTRTEYKLKRDFGQLNLKEEETSKKKYKLIHEEGEIKY